jgi:hypothetical protein
MVTSEKAKASTRYWFGRTSVVALALSLSACAGMTVGGNGGVFTDSEPAAESTRDPIPSREVSPFDEFRNLLWGFGLDDESRARQFQADRVRQEDMIAQCMNDLGFEYIPYLDYATADFGGPSDWNTNDLDWVTQYGFGVTTSPPGERGSGWLQVTLGNLGPNNAILEELSAEGESAWRGAFMNRGAGWTRTINGVDYMDCFNWSWAVIQNEHQAGNSEEFAPLVDAISQMQTELLWDISDADRDWSRCMAEAGYSGFDTPWQASNSITVEMNSLQSRLALDPDWDYGNPTADNSPEFADLQSHELALATASLGCKISTDFEAKRAAHVTAIENQFITDHRAELEALRAAAEQRH